MKKILLIGLLLMCITALTFAEGYLELIPGGSFESGTITDYWTSNCADFSRQAGLPVSWNGNYPPKTLYPAFGSWLMAATLPASTPCSITSDYQFPSDSTVCFYYYYPANQVVEFKIGGGVIEHWQWVGGYNNGWGNYYTPSGDGTRNGGQGHCIYTGGESGALTIEMTNPGGSSYSITLDYVQVFPNYKRFPTINSISQDPSPANYGSQVRLDVNTEGITQKIKCGTTEIDDVTKNVVDYTFDVAYGLPELLGHGEINEERAGAWFFDGASAEKANTEIDINGILDGVNSFHVWHTSGSYDSGIKFNGFGGDQVFSSDGLYTISDVISTGSSSDIYYQFYKCLNPSCSSSQSWSWIRNSYNFPRVRGTLSLDVNIVGLNTGRVDMYVDNLRYQGKTVGGTTLCESSGYTTDPWCQFINDFNTTTTIYCEAYNTYGESWLNSYSLSALPPAPPANPQIYPTIAPTSPDTNDDLVPTVFISYAFPDDLNNNYYWQYRDNIRDLIWTTYSSGLLTRIASTDYYTVPTISSDDTNSGNLWRLYITSIDDTNNLVQDSSYSNVVGIDTDVSLITAIENINIVSETYDAETDSYTAIIEPSDEEEDIIFKVINSSEFTIDLNIVIQNSLNDGKQYFVNTATGIQYASGGWVFDSSETYGTTNANPIQKLWDNNISKYQYYYDGSFGNGDITYYKLNYRSPMTYWETITGDANWYFTYPPNNQTSDGQTYDVIDVGILNPLTLEYPIGMLGLPDVNTDYAFEFQFTAYALSNMDIQVSGETVSITTQPHRYSVSFSDVNAITLSGTAAIGNTLYFTDWAVMQRGYWRTKMFFLKENYEPLDVWIDESTNTSYKYFDEGFSFRTGATGYDREGEVTTLKVEVYGYTYNDVNRIKYAQYDVNYGIETTFDFDQLIENVVITADPPTGESLQYRSLVRVKATICGEDLNGNETCYEQLDGEIYMRNYPFFNNDAIIQIKEEARQPNTAPHGEIVLKGREDGTDAFERVNLYIYKGAYICPPFHSTCGGIAASDDNLMYQYEFDNLKDWTCDPQGNCDFDYDLRNYWKYSQEGTYTTFAQIRFNTWDANTWYARTLYEIGKQPMAVGARFMGLSTDYYSDATCFQEYMGQTIDQYASKGDLVDAVCDIYTSCDDFFLGLIGHCSMGAFGCEALYSTDRAQAEEYAQEIIDANSLTVSNPLAKMLAEDLSTCSAEIPANLNYKIKLTVHTQKMTDVHPYLNAYLYVTDPTDPSIIYTPTFYPIEKSFNIDTRQNEIYFNTIFYDINGNYLADGTYKIWIFVNDQSLMNNDTNTSLNIDINGSVVISDVNSLEFIPITFEGVDDTGTLTLRNYFATRDKYVDRIEFILYTQYSSFDELKTDKENQIIKWDMDSEDIELLKKSTNFELTKEWRIFKQDYVGIDIIGACTGEAHYFDDLISILDDATGGTLGSIGILDEVTDSARVGAYVTMAGACGANTIASFIVVPLKNADLNTAKMEALESFDFSEYKTIDVQIKDLRMNDYYALREYHGLSEEETSPYTLINDLAKIGEGTNLSNLILNIAGHKVVKENVLVGDESFEDELRSGKVKMQILIYYDYERKVKQKFFDLSTWQKNPEDWLGNFNTGASQFVTENAILFIIGTFALIAFAYFRTVIMG